MATETEEADLTGEDLRYISEAARIRAAMDRAAAVQEKRQQEATARADREAAQREWDTMVKNGSTPQEATRLLGRRLYGSSPTTMERAIRWATPASPVPTGYVTNLPGLDRPLIAQPSASGATTYKPAPPPIIEKSAPQPPDVKQNLLMLNREISAKEKALSKAKEEASGVEAKGALLDLMTDLDRTKDKAVQTSTNYPGYKPNAPKGAESSSQFRKQNGIVYQKVGDKWVPVK